MAFPVLHGYKGPFRKIFPDPVSGVSSLFTNETGTYTQNLSEEIILKIQIEFIFIISSTTGLPLFVTPYLKQGQWKLAQELAKVDSHSFGPNVKDVVSYAGYFTVNTPDCGSNMFFWYFPAEVSN